MPGDWGERVILGQCEVISRVNLKYYEKGRVTSGMDMGEREKEQIVSKLGGFKTSACERVLGARSLGWH